MSAAGDQKWFCVVCSASKCSFDKFVGEKVVSLSYSSAILARSQVLIFLYGPALTSIHAYRTNHSFDHMDLAYLHIRGLPTTAMVP